MTRSLSLNKDISPYMLMLIFVVLLTSTTVRAGEQITISKSNFIYTPSEMLSFNIEQFLNSKAPHLAHYSETVSHWSGRSSISPRILLALLEHQSNAISQPGSPKGHNSESSRESVKMRLATQIKTTSIELAKLYYKNLQDNIAQPESAALQSFFLSQKAVTADPLIGVSDDGAIEKGFSDTYDRLFPGRLNEGLEQNFKELGTNSLPPPNLFQLPYPVGEAWQTWGGTHSFPGTNSGPRSSLDFRRDRQPFGADTSFKWVSSSSNGQAVRHSSCFVEVIGPNGWSTSYYHLDNVAVNTGQGVSRNQRLANYADNLEQSLCGGGKSNGPHVHFSLKLNGNYHPLDGVKLSGYSVHTGRTDYDSNCSFFWLDNNGSKICAGVPAQNNGIIIPAPDLSLESFNASFESVKSEQTVTASVTITNLGDGVSPDTQLTFLLSTDPALSFNDTKLRTNNIAGLNPDQSTTSSATIKTGLEPGEYWLGACILGVQGESNSSNNCSTAFPIVIPEDSVIVLPLILLLDDEDLN